MVQAVAIKLPEALVRFFIDIAVNPANVIKIFRDLRRVIAQTLELDLPMCSKVHDSYDELLMAIGEDIVEEPIVPEDVQVAIQ